VGGLEDGDLCWAVDEVINFRRIALNWIEWDLLCEDGLEVISNYISFVFVRINCVFFID